MIDNIHIYRAKSFTSLKAELNQDINRIFVFIRYINGTFP